MKIEEFACSETQSEPAEACAEAKKLIEELGLSGQKSLEAPEDKPRWPYRLMTTEEHFVYGFTCPKQMKIEKYAESPMPLRILQIAAHAKSLNVAPYIHVWAKESFEVKDPVLVAATHESPWHDGYKLFLLARWGDELEEFGILRKRAIAALRERLKSQAKALCVQVESASDEEVMKRGPAYHISW